MLMLPKKSKYRRTFKGKRPGLSFRGSSVDFGDYGLKSLGRNYVTSRQLEAARKAIVHHLKRGGKLWIRVFPDKPITKKPNEVRMGSGKGAVDHYATVVKPGRILFELSGVSKTEAYEAFKLAGDKLPIATKIVVVGGSNEE